MRTLLTAIYGCYRTDMWKTVLFLLYVGLIPLVPLIGAERFKARGETKKKWVCRGLFLVQLLLSVSYACAWLAA